jgi:hypothetical protein
MVRVFVAAVVCWIMWASAAHAQAEDDVPRMLADVSRLHREGKFADAIPIAERAAALARQRHTNRT